MITNALIILLIIISSTLLFLFLLDKKKAINTSLLNEQEDLNQIQQKFSELQLTLSKTINEISEKETRSREIVKNEMLDQLSNRNSEFFNQQRTVINSDLNKSKELIDLRLSSVEKTLTQVSQIMNKVEQDNSQRHGKIGEELKQHMSVMSKLNDTTNKLKETLSSTKLRGQWGERIAEDVLSLAGFIENINYTKQTTIEEDGKTSRPDFTFFMPNKSKLHMDVKFPLENYVKMVESNDDHDRIKYTKIFISDIKKHINDLKIRKYHESEDTIPCVLLFLPNEQIFYVIQEAEYGLVDNALKEGILLCSPMTLFAVLAVFRQGAEMFKMETASRDLFKAVKEFQKEWDRYSDEYTKSLNKFQTSMKGFEAFAGTRHNALQRKINKINLIGEESQNPTAIEE